MKHEPIKRDETEPETLAEAVARARISYAARQGVEHRVVTQWLLTWGEPGRESFGEWLANWDG